MFSSIFSRNSPTFKELPQTEDTEKLISGSDTDSNASELSNLPKRSIISRCITPLTWLLSVFGAFMFGVWIGTLPFSDADSFCTAHIAQSSPVMRDVPMSYETVIFNGSLFLENEFRQTAGPDSPVDDAWTSLGVDYRALIVPAEDAERAGIQLGQVQVSDKYGGGFPANVEGLHHLHCLNLVRQSLYYNYDYYHSQGKGAFKNDDKIVRFHVSHCLDILRQQLMCNVDIGLLGQVWWNRPQPQAYPDFNTQHKCRNFEGVRKWAEERQAPVDVPDDYLVAPLGEWAVFEAIP